VLRRVVRVPLRTNIQSGFIERHSRPFRRCSPNCVSSMSVTFGPCPRMLLEAAWMCESCPFMNSLESLEEVLLARDCTLQEICGELAKLFGVRWSEIGLLRLEGDLLRFIE